MRLLVLSALVLMGVHWSLRTIAALYRTIDLWYTIRTAYPAVVRGIVVWPGGAVAMAWLLAGGARAAFLAGFAAFVAIHVGLYLVRPFVLRPRAAHRETVEKLTLKAES